MSIVILGDSNTAFFCNDSETLILAEQGVPGYASADKLMHVDGEDVHISWIFGKSAHGLTDQMLIDMTANIDLSKAEYIVFAFGGVDMKLFMYQNKDYRDAIRRYQKLCFDFAKSHNVKLVFLLTIIRIEHIKNFKLWKKYFKHRLSDVTNVEVIDVFDKFSMDYASDSFDKWNHMTLAESQEVLKYIIQRVKSL